MTCFRLTTVLALILSAGLYLFCSGGIPSEHEIRLIDVFAMFAGGGLGCFCVLWLFDMIH